MDTRHRGDTAEAAVLYDLVSRGMQVFLPWSPFTPCDLMALSPLGAHHRLQVKSGRVRNGCILANARSTDHGSGPRSYVGLVDAMVIHVPELSENFVVPIDLAQGAELRLRLTPTRNGQRRRVRPAAEYRLADWVERVIGDAVAA